MEESIHDPCRKILVSDMQRELRAEMEALSKCTCLELLAEIKKKLLEGGESAFWFAHAVIGTYYDQPVNMNAYRSRHTYDRLLFKRYLDIDKTPGYWEMTTELSELVIWAQERWKDLLAEVGENPKAGSFSLFPLL